LLALLTGAGLFNFGPASSAPVNAPTKAADAVYGKYVLGLVDCAGCHGPNLDGNVSPPQKKTPNLTKIVTQWSKDDFFKMARTGAVPGGWTLDNKTMPWKSSGRLDDVELEALYMYLHGLKAVATK
jgi:mono/diheme cytochrome c family protein